MKERQDSLAARIAGTIAGGVRRRQQEREPRALVYDGSGEPHLLPPGGDDHAALVAIAETLVDVALAGADEPAAGADPDDGDGDPDGPGAGGES